MGALDIERKRLGLPISDEVPRVTFPYQEIYTMMPKQNGKQYAKDCFDAHCHVMSSVKDAINNMYGVPKLHTPNHLRIKNVIFNNPATIVFWEDGTKTVVKAVDEAFDPEKGLAMAFTKKSLGNQGNYFNQLKKWIPTKEEENDA